MKTIQEYLLLLPIITVTFLNGMELSPIESILKKKDILISLNKSLGDEWDLARIKIAMHKLPVCSKALYLCYAKEDTRKNIVRMLSNQSDCSDLFFATMLGYETVANKIEVFFKITEKHSLLPYAKILKRNWYLNATRSFLSPDLSPDTPQTLLHQAIESMNLDNFHILLNAKIGLNNSHCENPLRLAVRRYFCAHSFSEARCFFSMIALLLERGLKPDAFTITRGKQSTTALTRAVLHGDQKLARLLLDFGADPYETMPLEERIVNCFHAETGKSQGWLKTMYDEIQKANQQLDWGKLTFKRVLSPIDQSAGK